jgi:hypothetical protein
MIFYIWRVPTMLGVMACSALVLLAAIVIAALVIRRRRSPATTVAMMASVGTLIIGTVVATRMTAARIASWMDVSAKHVDPGIAGYLAPPTVAAFLFLVGDRVLDRRWTDRRALLFFGWVLTFIALNVVNYCSPGWCETIGFPLAWLKWSDSILTFGDPDAVMVEAFLDKAVPAIAALVDLFVFIVIARGVTCRKPPETDRALPPPSQRCG